MKPPTLFLVIFCVVFSSCGPPKVDSRTVYQKEGHYPHSEDLKTPIALFVRERNGSPHIMASAFLIDKQQGLFASAKHFVGSDSDGECKIFFNGKVYNGFLQGPGGTTRLLPITDVVGIQILGDFDPSDFPEPYKIAPSVSVGDKVFIRGIHPHDPNLQTGRPIIRIYAVYYGMLGKDKEFVYDNLEAKVADLNWVAKNESLGISQEVLAEISNTFIRLEARNGHRLSFGGLSGGPTVNENNELVGINSFEEVERLERQNGRIVFIPWGKFLHLVPGPEVAKLLSQSANAK